jgi:hypothetical protein
VLERLWTELGVGDTLRCHVGRRNRKTIEGFERAIFAMVANRALEPYSKLYCCHNPDEEKPQSVHRAKFIQQLEAELAAMQQQPGRHTKRACEMLASARFGHYLRQTSTGLLEIDRTAVREAARYGRDPRRRHLAQHRRKARSGEGRRVRPGLAARAADQRASAGRRDAPEEIAGAASAEMALRRARAPRTCAQGRGVSRAGPDVDRSDAE